MQLSADSMWKVILGNFIQYVLRRPLAVFGQFHKPFSWLYSGRFLSIVGMIFNKL